MTVWRGRRISEDRQEGGRLMYENLYKMAGNVAIPEEKREEFNQHVLQILYKGGIRKTDT